MSARKSWDEYFFDIADMVATRSTCPRLQVGCVIVDENHRIVSTGYNGSAPREEHCEDVGCALLDGHCKRTIHAEVNAVLLINWSHQKLNKRFTAYVTHTPCESCRAFLENHLYEDTRMDVKWRKPYGV